jgi:hypothetical protein|tara:strand:+ start:14185 stop:14508 length:324 start_codon:yes stop_codon:yes gene_type:complete
MEVSAKININPYLGSRGSKGRTMNVTEEQFATALAACNWEWHDITDDATDEQLAAYETAKASYELVASMYDALLAKYSKDKKARKKVHLQYNAAAPDMYKKEPEQMW